jgi:signal transduction histidine kinase
VIVARVLGITLLYAVVLFIVIGAEIGALLSDVRNRTLTNEMWEVGSYLHLDAAGRPRLDMPQIRTEFFSQPDIDYIIRDTKGRIVFHAPDPWVNYKPPETPARDAVLGFEFTGPNGAAFVGRSGWVVIGKTPFLVQVTQSRNTAAQFPDRLRDVFLYKVTLLTVPFTIFLILAVIFSTRRVLGAVTASSSQAQAISFESAGGRVPEVGLPDEIRPLVRAFNDVLGRFEAGIRAQKEFAARAAHELRTPLSVLLSRIELLTDAAARAKLAADVKAMSRLVGQLLAAARLEHPGTVALQEMDLAAALREASLSIWPALVERSIGLEVSGAENAVMIRGNEEAVKRVFGNLLENAMRHAPRGSTIAVAMTGREVRVRDQGPGIAPEDRTRIFDMFWRKGEGAAPGAGLGLYIVKTTMTLHGGAVRVEEAPGGGALFVLDFPAPPAKTNPGKTGQ